MRGLPAAATWSCIHMTIAVLTAMWAAGMCSAVGDESEGRSFEMRMMYKYSEEFQELMKGRPDMEHVVSEWPHPGTPEFYHKLALHDRHRHASRNLITTDVYSLAPTNETFLMDSLGGLHYSFILLGTPPKLFFVALDTGSDLLWVPCDCQQCSVANWTSYGITIPGLEFAVYNTSNSTSSKAVACTDAICSHTLSPSSCKSGSSSPCSYTTSYLSANTSSSGTLVEDVVYLNPETSTGANMSADIYFGCGKIQTGDFLAGGAPNGLFGLGPEAYSVPATLARNGITQNVFSMCFSKNDSSGRLVFGRKPDASLQSTPLVPISPSVFYEVELAGFVVGGVNVNVSGGVVFDTGTSITTAPSHVVKSVGDILASRTILQSFSFNFSQTVFNYCWNVSTNADIQTLSSLSIVFGGGATWTINYPLIGIGDKSGDLLFVCLGMVASDSLNGAAIIGFNFMEDYEYFFDHEASTLSWVPSNCSGYSATNTTIVPPVSAPIPEASPPVSAPIPEAPPPVSAPIPEASPPVESTPTPLGSTPRSPPPPRASLPQAPTSSNASEPNQTSKAFTISLQHMPFQALFLLVSTSFILLLAT